MLRWLSRGKLWDDVLTRTLSALIAGSLIAGFALAAGIIHFDAQAWRATGFVVLAIAVGVGLGVDNYLRHSDTHSKERRDRYQLIRRSVRAGFGALRKLRGN
jgi:hypothetical protein